MVLTANFRSVKQVLLGKCNQDVLESDNFL